MYASLTHGNIVAYRDSFSNFEMFSNSQLKKEKKKKAKKTDPEIIIKKKKNYDQLSLRMWYNTKKKKNDLRTFLSKQHKNLEGKKRQKEKPEPINGNRKYKKEE